MADASTRPLPQVVAFFKPGLDILTAFLPSFFAPGLVLTPLAAAGISSLDFSKFLGILTVNLFLMYATVTSQFHIATLIIYELRSRKFSTQQDHIGNIRVNV